MPNFRYGFATISNEESSISDKYHGHRTGETVVISGEYVKITFRFRGRGRGFFFRFNAIPIGMYMWKLWTIIICNEVVPVGASSYLTEPTKKKKENQKIRGTKFLFFKKWKY